MIVDLFCGAGGWSAGLEALGYPAEWTLGVEYDQHAAATHIAAGFPTFHGDILDLDPTTLGPVDGLIASPPCQAFSLAGRGAGRDAIADLLQHIDRCADGWVEPDGHLVGEDVRADLTLQPLKWADLLRPTWCAFEQVPPVMPAWEHIAHVLSGWGYSTWTGLLSSERYGVPQTRKRAILLARRDGQPAAPPAPTHTAYDHRRDDGGRWPEPSLFGDDLEPWVSMADALGWGMPDRPFYTYAGVSETSHAIGDREFGGSSVRNELAERAASGDPSRWRMSPNGSTGPATAGNIPRRTDEPAATITGVGSAAWVETGANTMRYQRDHADDKYRRSLDAPAPTVDSKVGGAWTVHRPATTVQTGDVITSPGHHPAFDVEPGTQTKGAIDARDWPHERPSTTVVGSFRPDIIAAPGWRGAGDGPRQDAPSSVRVSVEQAATLQSFPSHWPWRGPKTARYRQIGNAVPPLMAAAIIRQVSS